MTQKWNLQDIRPANTQKPAPPREAPLRRPQVDIAQRPQRMEHRQEAQSVIDPDIASIDVIDGNGAKRTRVFVTIVISAIILIAGYGMNVLLGGAEVTVYPKIRDVSVQADFTAQISPQAGDLGYELLTLEAEGEKQVKANGKEKVSTRAEGKIFIFNAKSTSVQRLVKNTRFESPDGLIYKIKDSIEVPGASKDTQGNMVPGSIVADVLADGTGEQYNLAPGKFTVPGLKGSDQYDNVYGETKAAFTNGFEGEKYIIDETELGTAKQALHIELRDKLLAELKEKRPAGFIVYDNAVTFAFDSLPSTEYGDSLATIKEKARLQVPMFKEDEFSKYIALKTIPPTDYSGDPVTILDPQSLAFTYISATTSVSDISPLSSLDFTLKGTARIIWKFDEAKLKSELISIKKNAATSVFSKYSSISNAQAEIRPFWKTAFPDTPDKIKVTTVLEKK
jgi:hypothetical protein